MFLEEARIKLLLLEDVYIMSVSRRVGEGRRSLDCQGALSRTRRFRNSCRLDTQTHTYTHKKYTENHTKPPLPFRI